MKGLIKVGLTLGATIIGFSTFYIGEAKAGTIVNSGNEFIDTATGFVWKDIDLFFSKTRAQVESMLDGTSFTLANKAQVEQLLSNNQPGSVGWLNLNQAMCSFDCAGAVDRDLIWGRYDDGNKVDGSDGYAFAFSYLSNWQIADNVISVNDSEGNSFNKDFGAFVVSTTATAVPPATAVPTPALLPGLIGMGVAALRKKGKKEELVAQEA